MELPHFEQGWEGWTRISSQPGDSFACDHTRCHLTSHDTRPAARKGTEPSAWERCHSNCCSISDPATGCLSLSQAPMTTGFARGPWGSALSHSRHPRWLYCADKVNEWLLQSIVPAPPPSQPLCHCPGRCSSSRGSPAPCPCHQQCVDGSPSPATGTGTSRPA